MNTFNFFEKSLIGIRQPYNFDVYEIFYFEIRVLKMNAKGKEKQNYHQNE